MKTNTHSVSAASQFSHELRIPLTGILGMAHFLEKTQLTSEQKRYLSILQNSAEQLLGLENKLYLLYKQGKRLI